MTKTELDEKVVQLLDELCMIEDKMYEAFYAARGGHVGLDGPKPPGYQELHKRYFVRFAELHFRYFVSKYPWILSKTYSNVTPHEYYIKSDLDEWGQSEFMRVVEYIREQGFLCKFSGKEYMYYELDGYYYWTVGDPVEETNILNRCRVEDYSVYGDCMVYKGNGSSELSRIYAGEPVLCRNCGQGIFLPLNQEYPIGANHCFVCSHCGNSISVTPNVTVE